MGKNRDRQESDQGFLNHELESLYHKIADEKLTDTAEGDLPRDEIRIAPGRPERKGQTEDPEADRESGMLGGNRVARLFLFTVPVLVIAAFVLFIWPTPYEYSTLKTSDRTYLVKTNRLTHTKVFFQNGKWLTKPLPEMPALRLPDPLAIKSPGDKPLRVNEEPVPAADDKTREGGAEPPSPSLQPQTQPGPSRSASNNAASAPVPARPAPDLKAGIPVPPVSQAISRPERKESRPGQKPYAVQIRAFQNEKELNVFLREKDVKKRRDIHWSKTRIKDQVWYRVFLGRFPDQDAARKYMQKNKIDSRYPGSFVQKII